MIDFEVQPSTNLEVVLQVRDGDGNPTGKTVRCADNSGDVIYDFYEKHSNMMTAIQKKGKKHRKNNKKNNRKNRKGK